MADDSIHPKAPRPNTKEQKMALAKRAIEAKDRDGTSYEDFQRSLNMDIGKATLNYWISEYKKSQKPKFPTPRTTLPVVQKPSVTDLAHAYERQIEDLTAKLDEANRTIKAQHNVIIILGHQHTKDE